jgi:hypothetical protein
LGSKIRLIRGEILLDRSARPFSDAKAFIRLTDVGYADAQAKLILQQTIDHVNYGKQSNTSVKFNLYGIPPKKQSRYAINIHVDIDRDGKVSKGDQINMQHYPISEFGLPNLLRINVTEVK